MECHVGKENALNKDKVCFSPIFFESFIVLRKCLLEIYYLEEF